MSLYKQWVDLMEGQTEETFEAFWEEYSGTETRIYENILENKDVHLAANSLRSSKQILLFSWASSTASRQV